MLSWKPTQSLIPLKSVSEAFKWMACQPRQSLLNSFPTSPCQAFRIPTFKLCIISHFEGKLNFFSFLYGEQRLGNGTIALPCSMQIPTISFYNCIRVHIHNLILLYVRVHEESFVEPTGRMTSESKKDANYAFRTEITYTRRLSALCHLMYYQVTSPILKHKWDIFVNVRCRNSSRYSFVSLKQVYARNNIRDWCENYLL